MKKYIILILFLIFALFLIAKFYPNNLSISNGSDDVIITDEQIISEQPKPIVNVETCSDGQSPDSNGCCAGEVFQLINGKPFCCPENDTTADCFEPLKVNQNNLSEDGVFND